MYDDVTLGAPRAFARLQRTRPPQGHAGACLPRQDRPHETKPTCRECAKKGLYASPPSRHCGLAGHANPLSGL